MKTKETELKISLENLKEIQDQYGIDIISSIPFEDIRNIILGKIHPIKKVDEETLRFAIDFALRNLPNSDD